MPLPPLWGPGRGIPLKKCAHIVCSRGGRNVGTAAQRDDLLGWVAVFVLISLLVNVRTRCRLLITVTWSKFTGWIMCRRTGDATFTDDPYRACNGGQYEMIFTQPDSVTYSKTGMLLAQNWYQKAPTFCPVIRKSPTFPGLCAELRDGGYLPEPQITLEELMASADPYTLIFSRPSRYGAFMTAIIIS